MYRPKAFRVDDAAILAGFVDAHPLAMLVTTGSAGIHTTQLPMFVSGAQSGYLYGHIARANPQWRTADVGVAAVAVFRTAEQYISPSWYATTREHGRVVPTYDYIAVEARGRIRFFEDVEELRALVTRLTDREERRVGSDWKVTDAPSAFVDAELAAIVGVELTLEQFSGSYKLSQNRSDEDVAGVLAGLDAAGTPQAASVAAIMRALQT